MTFCLSSGSYFNPRSPWGERQFQRQELLRYLEISIHAPRGGSDRIVYGKDGAASISIHAPRGGSDSLVTPAADRISHFNPRSPWGERPLPSRLDNIVSVFQSTLPVGGATGDFSGLVATTTTFQSTLPVGGATVSWRKLDGYQCQFQSTLPVGGATAKMHSFPCPSLARITKVGEKTARKAHYNVKNNGCRQFSHKKVRAKLWGNFCSLALRS